MGGVARLRRGLGDAGERRGAHPDRVRAAQQHGALAKPAQRRVGVAAGEPDVAEQERGDGPALRVGRGGVGALGLVGGLVEAAGEPVRERLRAGELALRRRLPAPGDRDRLVAAPADGERLGHRDRGAHPRGLGRGRIGLDRRGHRQRRARVALREREPRAQRVQLGRAGEARGGASPRRGASGRAARPAARRSPRGEDRFRVGGAVERPEEVAGADERRA